jgi:hypothetical protein
MRILGALRVREAADVDEAAVRHNLRLLDGLVVRVQPGADGTRDVLAALAAEGLPVAVHAEDDPIAAPAAVAARALRDAFAVGDPDWVIELDAADFVVAPSRADLERALGPAAAGAAVALARALHVPDFAAAGNTLAALARSRRVPMPDAPAPRHAYPRGRADAGAVTVAADSAGASIASVPVRSRAQLVADATIAWLAALAAGTPPAAGSWLDAVYADIRADRARAPGFVDAAGVNFGLPRAAWRDPARVALVDAPFLAPIELRHVRARPPFPLGALIALGEYLAANESARVAGQLLRGRDAGAALAGGVGAAPKAGVR